jgi:hypothetical protein
MSESKATPMEGSLSEMMDQILMEHRAYRVGLFILLVHAGKISFDAAFKALELNAISLRRCVSNSMLWSMRKMMGELNVKKTG